MSNPKRTLDTILDIATRLGAVVHQNRQHALTDTTDSGKYARRYNQAEAIHATGAHAKNIRGLCDKLGITYQDGNSWRISIDDVMALRQLLNPKPFVRSASQQLQIITISSLKGGATKTTTAATLATGLVTECMNAYRVGVIDLDPQATFTTLLHPNADETYLSAGDLMTGDVELEEGETFEDACKAAFCQTNTPNLRILPAKDYDREYEVIAEQRKMQGGYVAYKDLQRIIDAVRDEFDIIIIDTAPQFSTATLAAHYVANNVIIPIRPLENDRDASHKYLTYLASMYQLLMGLGHQGYDNIKILLSCIRAGSTTQRMLANEIRQAIATADLFQNEIPDSEAVATCAKQYCTIFDMSAHEYAGLGSRRTLSDAQERYGLFIREVESMLLANWGMK